MRPIALYNDSPTFVPKALDCGAAEYSRGTTTRDVQAQAAAMWSSASTQQDVRDGMSWGHQEPRYDFEEPRGQIRSSVPLASGAPVTTLMIRNTVRYFRNDDALLLWPQQQYQYDILYVPHNCALGKSIGYAFINFLSPEYAAAFYNRWQGQCIPADFHGNGRPLDLQPAHRQGFDAIVSHWMVALKDKTMEPPVLFINGNRYDLHGIATSRAGVSWSTAFFANKVCNALHVCGLHSANISLFEPRFATIRQKAFGFHSANISLTKPRFANISQKAFGLRTHGQGSRSCTLGDEPGQRRYCTAEDIARGPILGSWVRRSEAPRECQSYGHFCPFLADRYRCVDKNTSANQWVFQPRVTTCSVGPWQRSFNMLAGRRLLLCGDSNLRQIFLETLCTFKNELLYYNGRGQPFVPNREYEVDAYMSKAKMEDWAAEISDDIGVVRGVGQPASSYITEHSARYAIIMEPNGGKLSVARFKNNLTIVYVHARYVKKNSSKEQTCLDTAARFREDGHVDLSPSGPAEVERAEANTYDYVIVNKFVNTSSMVRLLVDRGCQGSVFEVPRHGDGVFSENGPRPVTVRSKENKGAIISAPFEAYSLPLEDLFRSRSRDAMADIFPFLYKADTGSLLVCRAKERDPFKPCRTREWHICNAMPCAPDSHFCMPGPLDNFARLMFAAVAGAVRSGAPVNRQNAKNFAHR